MEQVVYRFYVFRYILAILTKKDVVFPKTITLKDIQKEIPYLEEYCLIGLMQEVVRCCKTWVFVQLDNDFRVQWQFQKPDLKQFSSTIWMLSSGDECKNIEIKKINQGDL